MSNRDLNSAKAAKCDEFYTQLTDIEQEMRHYRRNFKGKTVLCNCDDPEWSNFWRFFSLNFSFLGLKKLIATHYDASQPSYKLVKTATGTRKTTLKQNGDFRSPEAVALLEESDIVVTNPPFSLFRDYISLLAEHGKKFLVLGNLNAVTYKEIFPLIKRNKLWLGVSIAKEFEVPTDTLDPIKFTGEERGGRYYQKVMGVRWFTNLKHNKRNEEIFLYRTYNDDDYPTYDNYDAIEVGLVKTIPMDYDGYMGVPISFFDKYNPDQFEVLGNLGSYAVDGHSLASAIYVGGSKVYKRILIKRK